MTLALLLAALAAPADAPAGPTPAGDSDSQTQRAAADPDGDDDEEAGEEDELTAAQERRQARLEEREARREAWRNQPMPPPEADLLRKQVDLRARLGFNGYTPGPFSLFTAFAGWNELGVGIDVGAITWRGFTIGFGGEAHYGQPWVLTALIQRVSNYDDRSFRWQMWEAGGTFRTTMHATALQSVDPYLFVGVGASAFHIQATERSWPRVDPAAATTPTLRIEAGGGLNIPIRQGPWFVGGELRYLITSQIGAPDRLVLRNGDQTAIFAFAPQHKPPKGFSWVIHVGYRFGRPALHEPAPTSEPEP